MHSGEYRSAGQWLVRFFQLSVGLKAAFITCSVVISLGYFIGLKKIYLIASTATRLLGYICDSEGQAFLLLQDKKIGLRNQEKPFLARKAFLLEHSKNSPVKLHLLLSSFWQVSYTPIPCIGLFLELPRVLLAKLNCLLLFEKKFSTGDSLIAGKVSYLGATSLTFMFNCFWMPLILDGVDALLALLDPRLWLVVIWMKPIDDVPSSSEKFRPCVSRWKISFIVPKIPGWMCLLTKKALVSSWEKVSKYLEATDIMNSIFQFSLSRNFSLSLQYFPSRSNPTDYPSRTLSDLDASPDIVPWNLVDSTLGPHTIDLMTLPSKVKLDRSAGPLKFLSPFPWVQSQGINVLSQVLSSSENVFVFPPSTLVGPILKFLASQPCQPFYNNCPRYLAQEILVVPPPASGFRCIQIGPKGG